MIHRTCRFAAALATATLLRSAFAVEPVIVAPQVAMAGRTATITLPYRTADHLLWVSSTKMADASPFVFKGLAIKPHEGPGGADLAVFTYTADKPGTAVLSFGLVPPGKMLIGPPSLVYTGPVAKRASVKLVAL